MGNHALVPAETKQDASLRDALRGGTRSHPWHTDTPHLSSLQQPLQSWTLCSAWELGSQQAAQGGQWEGTQGGQ